MPALRVSAFSAFYLLTLPLSSPADGAGETGSTLLLQMGQKTAHANNINDVEADVDGAVDDAASDVGSSDELGCNEGRRRRGRRRRNSRDCPNPTPAPPPPMPKCNEMSGGYTLTPDATGSGATVPACDHEFQCSANDECKRKLDKELNDCCLGMNCGGADTTVKLKGWRKNATTCVPCDNYIDSPDVEPNDAAKACGASDYLLGGAWMGDIGDWTEGAFNDAVGWTSNAANDVADWTSNTVGKIFR